jgi:hypothetical protein
VTCSFFLFCVTGYSMYVCLILVSFYVVSKLPKSFLSISLTNAYFVFRNNVHFVTQTIFAHINSFSVNQFVCLLFVCLSESMSILFFHSYILYFFLYSCQYRPLSWLCMTLTFQNSKWGLWSLLLTTQNVYCRMCILQFIHSRILKPI